MQRNSAKLRTALKESVAGTPTVSVIIEWYNATRAGARRGHLVLRRLIKEIATIRSANGPNSTNQVEVIITYNANRLSEKQVSESHGDVFESCSVLTYRLVPVENGTYCIQKNIGARQSVGQILVFLDSDVVPRMDGCQA